MHSLPVFDVMLGTTCGSFPWVPSLKHSADLLAQLFMHASSTRLTIAATLNTW